MRVGRALLVFAALLALQLASLRPGDRGLPPTIGDSVEVQNIGYNLAHGRGYRFDWDDPGWRRPYAAANADGRYAFVLNRHGSYPTLFRPPLMPLLVAACTRLVPGADVFVAWRGVDAALFSAAACLLWDAAVALGGGGAGAVLLAAVCLDPVRRRFVPDWWTEGLAFDGVAVLAWLAVVGPGPSRGRFRLATGVAVGLLCLARAIFVPLMPVLCLVLAAAEPLGGDGRLLRRARAAAVILGVACAVQAPWWARNVIVARRFVPLGTQGGFNLPDQYGSWAVFYDGEWSGRGIRDAWVPAAAGPVPLPAGYTEAEFATLIGDRRWHAVVVAAVCTSTASELAVSDAGGRAAIAWARAHPGAIPGLMAAKAWTLTRGDRLPLLGVAVAAAVGLVRRPRARGRLARLLALGGAYVVAVMLTHVVYQRFLVPLLPPLYVAAAVGLASLPLSRFRPVKP